LSFLEYVLIPFGTDGDSNVERWSENGEIAVLMVFSGRSPGNRIDDCRPLALRLSSNQDGPSCLADDPHGDTLPRAVLADSCTFRPASARLVRLCHGIETFKVSGLSCRMLGADAVSLGDNDDLLGEALTSLSRPGVALYSGEGGAAIGTATDTAKGPVQLDEVLGRFSPRISFFSSSFTECFLACLASLTGDILLVFLASLSWKLFRETVLPFILGEDFCGEVTVLLVVRFFWF
jgi:hypothetical protein